MPEVRFSITEKLNKIVVDISSGMGVDKSDYIKSLILNDIKDRKIKSSKKK